MTFRAISIALASLLLVGCATGTSLVGKVPEVKDQSQAAQVVVYRPSYYGMLIKNTIALDGEDMFEIAAFTSVQFAIDPGAHTLTIKCFSVMPPGTKEDSLKLVAKPKQTYYYQVNTVGGSRCATIAEGDEVAAFNTSEKTVKLGR